MAPEKPFYEGLDMLGRKVILPASPQRIVSLVPSQTELLCYLGLQSKLTGITKFCIRPENLKNQVAIIGGTKSVNIPNLLALKPDLVIANKEENTAQMVEEIQQHIPVWVSDVRTLEQSYQMVSAISEMLGMRSRGEALLQQLQFNFSKLPLSTKRHRAAYLIWKDPWMLAGKDTFIDAMMHLAGFENVADLAMGRYPVLSAEEIKSLQPEILLFSSEPYPFSDEKIKCFTEFDGIIRQAVDGRIFSWYGSSMLDFCDYVKYKFNK